MSKPNALLSESPELRCIIVYEASYSQLLAGTPQKYKTMARRNGTSPQLSVRPSTMSRQFAKPSMMMIAFIITLGEIM